MGSWLKIAQTKAVEHADWISAYTHQIYSDAFEEGFKHGIDYALKILGISREEFEGKDVKQ